MADACKTLLTSLAAQTPVYDQRFLEDYKPLDSAVLGRHETEAWKDGTGDTHVSDRIEIGQPDLSQSWQRINAMDCADACSAPRVRVAFGSTRNSYYSEQLLLTSQLFCLTQLRKQTNPADQFTQIMKGLKKLPEMYNTDFIRVHAFDFAPTVQVCADTFPTFTPSRGVNTDGQLTTINLGSTGALPQSELTWPYLNYLTTILGLEGYYEAGSGLADGMFNLITDPRAWFKLTNGNPDMKEMMALQDPSQASPLYKIGMGVQKPFGNIAPTLDKTIIRFQHMGNGILNRVEPYYNVASTTGIKRVVNPAWVNARYQLSYIWHPKAIRLLTPSFSKINEKVPSINQAMYGNWTYVNPQGVIQYEQPDGTLCTLNNDEQLYFYWLCKLELGFYYQYPEFMMPILHLVDGSGASSTVNSPVCGSAPQYVAQNYSDDPTVCTHEV